MEEIRSVEMTSVLQRVHTLWIISTPFKLLPCLVRVWKSIDILNIDKVCFFSHF